MHYIPYGRQHITDADIQAVVQTLQSDFLTQGPKIKEFENAFAAYIGSHYALAVANGTAALHLCALALEVSAHTNVITSPITFVASANCVRYCGGTVWFADIDAQTGLMDLAKVEELIKSKPAGFFSGIIPVDFAGYPIDMYAWRKLADAHGLWIIEDACHAPGAVYTDQQGKEQKSGNGSFADLAIFSFHPVKHIATGEGGMITTNNLQLYEKLLLLRTHGITKEPHLLNENHGGWYYEMQELGFNYRMTDLLAALGLSQLNRADASLSRRQDLAQRYDVAFLNEKNLKILNPAVYNPEIKQIKHAYHLYIILIDNREGLYNFLKENGILAQVHYIPVPAMPYYRELGWQTGDFPVAENYYRQCLSLPLFPSFTDEEQAFVIQKVKEWLVMATN